MQIHLQRRQQNPRQQIEKYFDDERPKLQTFVTAGHQETAVMRFQCALGIFALIVCFEKPAHAQNQPWCIYKNYGDGLPVRDIATMFGGPARNRRVLWTQSAPDLATATHEVAAAFLRGSRAGC
jgi:hypothetical protein